MALLRAPGGATNLANISIKEKGGSFLTGEPGELLHTKKKGLSRYGTCSSQIESWKGNCDVLRSITMYIKLLQRCELRATSETRGEKRCSESVRADRAKRKELCIHLLKPEEGQRGLSPQTIS